MTEPQSPPQWLPPPPPEKKGLSSRAVVGIIVAVVVVVVIIGAVVAGAFLAGVQNASNLSKPNMAITNTDGTYAEDCGTYGTQTTDFTLSATLVNTGGAGYADIGYDVNDQQVATNTYYVGTNSQLPISQSFTLHACYGTATPLYKIVLLTERPA